MRVSILIPTRNRRESLARALAGLSAQRVDAGSYSYEVVVVSDGSTDGTQEMTEALATGAAWAGAGRKLLCIQQPWKGASAARNTALRAAAGEIVLFLDDDVQADPNLLAAHVQRHEGSADRGKVVLGRILVEKRKEALHRQMRAWWADHYSRLAQSGASWPAFFTGNVSLPRQAAMDAGGLDESLDYGEDVEFGYRLNALGLEFEYEPRALVRTTNPKPARAVLDDLARSGRGSVRTFRKFPQALRGLPLSGYGETSIRLRLVRGLLLRAAERPWAERVIDYGFSRWADSKGLGPVDRQIFELARSLYFWRGVRAEAGKGELWKRLASPGVPVLVYHSVGPVRGRPQRYEVDSRRFVRQMALLRWLGYRVEPLDCLVKSWKEGMPPPSRSAAITFDDGYTDNKLYAWPTLRRFGYPATLFMVCGAAGQVNSWDVDILEGRKPLLRWMELRELDKSGFRAEAHSVSHPDLTSVSSEVAEYEIRESQRRIEEELGRRVTLFAYPYGRLNNQVKRIVEDAGYDGAFSATPGLNTLRTDRFALKRVGIDGQDNLVMFALKLWLGEDPVPHLPVIGPLVKSSRQKSRGGYGA